jgi:hypothetical protein
MTQHTRMIRRGAAFMAAGLVAAGCGGDVGGTGTWSGTVQDSAGVRIVTSPAEGLWTDAAAWRVEEDLRIGVAEGDPELQFGMIGGIDVDAEGRIYALDTQAGRVRVFDPEGELITAFGRIGGGPGELSQAAVGLFVDPARTVLVPDMMNQRVARFSAEGEPLPSATLSLEAGIPMAWSRSPEGHLLQQVRRMDLPGAAPSGARPTDFILVLGEDGAVRDTLASFPAGETFTMGGPGGAPRIRFFSPERVWAPLDGLRVVMGLNSEYSLSIREGSGEVSTIIRRDFIRRPVTERETRAFLQALFSAWEDAGVPPAAAAQMRDNVEFEDHWPALAALLPGPEGTVWVQRVDPETALDPDDFTDLQSLQPGSPAWDVFDDRGRYLGVVDMPERFTPSRILEDRVYGIHRDDLGVQRVMRLRLDRPVT